MNEQKIKDIIQYYYPDTVIHENRYVNQMGCSLWNKKEELTQFIQGSLDTDYRIYAESSLKRKVSKQYYTEHLRLHGDKTFLY